MNADRTVILPRTSGDETVVVPRIPAQATAVIPAVVDPPAPQPIRRPFGVRALRYTLPIAAGTTDGFIAAALGGYQTWTWAAAAAASALTVAAVVALVAGWWAQ